MKFQFLIIAMTFALSACGGSSGGSGGGGGQSPAGGSTPGGKPNAALVGLWSGSCIVENSGTSNSRRTDLTIKADGNADYSTYYYSDRSCQRQDSSDKGTLVVTVENGFLYSTSKFEYQDENGATVKGVVIAKAEFQFVDEQTIKITPVNVKATDTSGKVLHESNERQTTETYKKVSASVNPVPTPVVKPELDENPDVIDGDTN